jgi:glycosyltransferase involved in cell wall biosynthesis
MRIALLAPLVSPLAPPFLGGAQAMLYDLAQSLNDRGHEVTLYAANGSDIPGVRVVPTGIDPAALASFLVRPQQAASSLARPDQTPLAQAFAHVYDLIARNAAEHDIIHAHAYDWAAFAYARRQPLPVVHTLHLPALDPLILDALTAPLPERAAPVRLVTVSRACAETYTPRARIDAVIYNGVDTDRMPANLVWGATYYLLYAGRISPEKGVFDAIRIANRAKRSLIIAGPIYDQTYFDERVAPSLDRSGAGAGVTYFGAVTRERLWDLMANAEALLCPVQWDEPFGLTACEAQATGTPVIGYARGGLREIVDSGRTGWLVAPGQVEQAAEAVGQAQTLDRQSCHDWVARHFSLGAMTDAYLRFYSETLSMSRV